MKIKKLQCALVVLMILMLSLLWGCGQNETARGGMPDTQVPQMQVMTTEASEQASETEISEETTQSVPETETTMTEINTDVIGPVEDESRENTDVISELLSEEDNSISESNYITDVNRATTEEETLPIYDEMPTPDYVINTNTKKFHYFHCDSVDDIKAENRWDYHGTRTDIINMGYVPCKKCNP